MNVPAYPGLEIINSDGRLPRPAVVGEGPGQPLLQTGQHPQPEGPGRDTCRGQGDQRCRYERRVLQRTGIVTIYFFQKYFFIYKSSSTTIVTTNVRQSYVFFLVAIIYFFNQSMCMVMVRLQVVSPSPVILNVYKYGFSKNDTYIVIFYSKFYYLL